MDLLDLLRDADRLRADLASPWRLGFPDHALALVGQLLAIEEQVRWDPSFLPRLGALVSGVSKEHDASAYASIAGWVLARSGTPGSAEMLIRACSAAHERNAAIARLSLASLARTHENAGVLRDALVRATSVGDPFEHLYAVALAGQRFPAADDMVLDFLSSHNTADAAPALVTLVCGRIHEAARLLNSVDHSSGPVGVTRVALGVIVDDAPLESLLAVSHPATAAISCRWIGRCPHPRSVDVLRDELLRTDDETAVDIVNSLALIGSRGALMAVIEALDDDRPLAAEAALHHVLQLGSDAPPSVSPAHEGPAALREASLALLPRSDRERVFRGAPLDARTDLDLLYLGYLPRIVWMQLTACWAPGVSFDPYADLVANLESMHALEDWHAVDGIPRGWVFQRRPV